jgi:hypothetical protein
LDRHTYIGVCAGWSYLIICQMYLNWHVNKFWTTSNKPFSESFAFYIDTLGIYGDNQSTQRVRIKSSCLVWMKW